MAFWAFCALSFSFSPSPPPLPNSSFHSLNCEGMDWNELKQISINLSCFTCPYVPLARAAEFRPRGPRIGCSAQFPTFVLLFFKFRKRNTKWKIANWLWQLCVPPPNSFFTWTWYPVERVDIAQYNTERHLSLSWGMWSLGRLLEISQKLSFRFSHLTDLQLCGPIFLFTVVISPKLGH